MTVVYDSGVCLIRAIFARQRSCPTGEERAEGEDGVAGNARGFGAKMQNALPGS